MSDALTPISLVIRLQTHAPGSSAPIGMYKDTACTLPATAAGDKVMAWRDELGTSGLKLTAASSATSPTLQFVDGYPVLRGDGTTSLLSTTGIVADFTGGVLLTVTVRKSIIGVNESNYRPLIRSTPANACGLQYFAAKTLVGFFDRAASNQVTSPTLDQLAWHVISQAVTGGGTAQLYKDTVAWGSPVTGSGATTATTSGQTFYLFSDGVGTYGDFDVMVLTLATSATNRATIETYQQSLIPPGRWSFASVALSPTFSWEANIDQEIKPIQLADGTYLATFSGGYASIYIGVCASPDGVNWPTKQANPLIGNGFGGEAGQVGRSNTYFIGNTLYCNYSDGAGSGNLKRATLTYSGGAWSAGSNVTLLPTTGMPTGVTGWTNSFVVQDGNTFHMFVEPLVNTHNFYSELWHCTSLDGASYSVPAVMAGLQRGTGMFGGPCVQKIGNRWWMTYHACYGSVPGSIAAYVLPTDIYQAYSDDSMATWTQISDPILRRTDNPFSLLSANQDQLADPRVLIINGVPTLYVSQLDNTNQKGQILRATNALAYPYASGIGGPIINNNSGIFARQ